MSIKIILFLIINIFVISSTDAALIGHWKFDEQENDIAIDSSQIANDGVMNYVEKTIGPMGNAIQLDGINGYIEVPHVEQYHTDFFTASVWLKHENLSRTCAYLRNYSTWHMRTGNGQWDIIINGERINSGYYFPGNEWHHYVMTIDNVNNQVVFYVDGKQIGDAHQYSNSFSESNSRYYIGQYGSGYRWKGGIDDLRFYAKVLKPEEIIELYKLNESEINNSPEPIEDGLAGFWKFDEENSDIVLDSSGLERNGQLFDTKRIKGILGGAIEFDGVNDYIEIAHNESFNSQKFTVSSWLYHDNANRTCAYMRRNGGWHIRTSNGQWDIVLEGGQAIYSGYYFPDKEWHHYAVSIDNIEQTVIFYVDGEQFGDVHYFNRGFTNPGGSLFIGQYSSGYRWKGAIDDVRIYTKIINPAHIKNLYKQGQILVGHWEFENEEIAYDNSNYENDGEMNNTELKTGIIGNAIQLNGYDSYIRVQNNDVFNAQIFTAAAWLNNENMSRTCAYLRRSGGWHIRTANGQWDIVLEGGERIRSGYYFPANEWHHYAISVNNINKTVKFYVDGEQFGDIHNYTNGFSDSSGYFYIGQYSSGYRWKGAIDDLRFYRDEISDKEIKQLYASGQHLVGHWKFDETDGSIALDSSLSKNDGTIVNSEHIDGYFDGALHLDGVNDYVAVQYKDVYHSDIFTITTWLYHENANRTCTYMRHNGAWHMRTSSGQWDIVLEGSTRERIASGYYFPDSEWHHYAITINMIEKTITFYVDGIQFGDIHTYTHEFSNSNGSLLIGQYSSGYRWQGGIDDVRYYTKALDDIELNKVFQNENLDYNQISENKIGHWKFDESSDNIAIDSSDLGNNGVMNNVDSINGQMDNAISLDGINGYVEVGHKEDYNTEVFTLASWLNHQNGLRTCAYMRRTGGWHIRTSNGQWDIALEGGQRISSGYIFPDNEWHHYAITVDNINKTVKFYVDGEQFGETHSYENGFSNQGGALYIGQYSSGYRWNGAIDDVQFYNYALSSEEIADLLNP